jgi:hypothetical protein
MFEWWNDVALWMDRSYVPLWVVCAVLIAYFCVKLWRELTLTAHREPPSE